jgi:hypothetical protein
LSSFDFAGAEGDGPADAFFLVGEQLAGHVVLLR